MMKYWLFLHQTSLFYIHDWKTIRQMQGSITGWLYNKPEVETD